MGCGCLEWSRHEERELCTQSSSIGKRTEFHHDINDGIDEISFSLAKRGSEHGLSERISTDPHLCR